MQRSPEPAEGSERDILFGWLAFHRDALAYKCEGLSDEQLVATSAPPSDLSLLGLVRHMTEMERVYAVYALTGPTAGSGGLELVYCTDDNEDGDIAGLTAAMAQPSLVRWHEERAAADALFPAYELDQPGAGNKRTLRWNLVKLIQEYARHNGHADIIRERIDGAKGE